MNVQVIVAEYFPPFIKSAPISTFQALARCTAKRSGIGYTAF